MKRSSLVICSFLAIGLLVNLTLTAIPARATAVTPQTGFTFNNPAGDRPDQYRIVNHLKNTLDATPRGATIRIAMYSMNLSGYVDRVLAAHSRGVNIRIVVNGKFNPDANNPQWLRLKKALGADISKPSFTAQCAVGCFDTRETTLQHSKLYLFSKAGSAVNVAMVGSGNPTESQAVKGYNNLYTVVGNTELYSAYRTYFDRMAKSASKKDVVDYNLLVTAGEYVTFLSPRQRAGDYYYDNVLSNISCRAASGYGNSEGKTIVTVVMSLWTKGRIDNARKLLELDEKGCDVRVIISAHGTNTDIQKILMKPTNNGGIIVRNASKDFDRDGTIDRYVHEKVVTINGGFRGKTNVKSVWVGSHNFTYNAMRGNNDIILRIKDDTAYDRYLTRYAYLASKSPRMTYVPSQRTNEASSELYQGMSATETTPLADEVLELSEE